MRIRAEIVSAFIRYSTALILPVVVLPFVVVQGVVSGVPQFMLFIAAVAVSAWRGGLGTGLTAMAMSLVLLDFVVFDPGQFFFASTPLVIEFVIFALVCTLISWMLDSRRRAEQSLRETKDQLEAILHGVADGIAVTNLYGDYVFANNAAAQLMWYPSIEQLKYTPPMEWAAYAEMTDEAGAPLSPMQLPSVRALREGAPVQVTYRLHHKPSGDERWIHSKATPIFNSDGRAVQAVMVWHDETESRQQVRMRERSEQHLRSILDALPLMVSVLNPDGVLLEANRTALQTADLQTKDVIGTRFVDMPWWNDTLEHQIQISAAIERARQGETVRMDTVVRVNDKTSLDVDLLITPMFDAAGELTYLIPAGLDITERKRSELERMRLTAMVEAQRQRLQRIIANVPGVIWEGTGKPGAQTIDFVSDYTEKMLGYSVKDWYDVPNLFDRLVHPDDLEQATTQAAQVYESGNMGSVQFRVIRKDGSILHVEAQTSIVADANGAPIAACGVLMDITHRKETERALAQYALELRRSNEELEQFAYVASHDLQEPLRMVTSYLQLIEQRYKEHLDADGHEFIAFAVDGASRMKALINDLLTYSRVQRSTREFEMVQGEQVINRVLDNLSVRIQETGAQITRDPLPVLYGDEGQLMQLFQNLISNAIKFCRDDPPTVTINVKRKGKEWVFAVRDNGIGIEPQYLERIFIIFQRLHNRSRYPGTGIGLAICKKVVERHGGQIWVESEFGVGSTFYFTLPAVEGSKHGAN